MWIVEYMTDGGWKPLRDLRAPEKPVEFSTHQQAEDAASRFRQHRILEKENEGRAA